jgi:pyridoxal phosphate enzyme (YggS family)
MSPSSVASRLVEIERRISEACSRCGRSRESVELVAVSKHHPVETLRTAYEAGLRSFGENYPQELRRKAEALANLPELRWHAVGGLQQNKVPLVARHAAVFHALSSVDVAQALSRRRKAQADAPPLDCYIQVNFGEAQKGGISEGALPSLVDEVRALPGLALLGLMGLPPLGDEPESSRPYFAKLRQLAERMGLRGLSMGMTADFEVAIQEGSTAVRVGTALFGERPRLQESAPSPHR